MNPFTPNWNLNHFSKLPYTIGTAKQSRFIFSMRELLELQSGQVAFLSGLMSGFSLSVAVHVLRFGRHYPMAKVLFLLFLVSSLLFLVALYVDVRLSIELFGIDSLPPALVSDVAVLRNIGTSCATVALVMFVVAASLLGWLENTVTGILSMIIGLFVMTTLWFVWTNINTLSVMVQKL